ncbi:ssDNA endonuclease and repair protein rad10 [Marasmius crinis-equi]|uniref:SsDNA endonuclease and repair protein rad10 n=1 Tax=Marasmius crinis-equi TaxID=585013 RepID=A0ABR3FI00_9AGAR
MPPQPLNPAKSTAPPVVVPGTGRNIVLNPLQRGNPILEHVKNVGTEYGDIIADYQVGRTTGVLFLSLKYHRLHPEYIFTRIEKLGRNYSLRILLVLCDVSEHKDPIRELTRLCLINEITIIVAFSAEEAGHYLATFKQFEFKPPTMIKERVDKDYNSMLRTSLTSISKVNKTDVETLRGSFGVGHRPHFFRHAESSGADRTFLPRCPQSVADMAKATPEQLTNLPGFGQVKVKNIKNAFEKPFRNNATNTLASILASQSSESQSSNSDKGKGKGKEQLPSRERDQSPAWDIEIQEPAAKDTGKGKEKEAPAAAREGSPEWDIEFQEPWDIELDLN